MALTACGGDDDETLTPGTPPVTVPPPAASVGDTIALTATNKVVSFNLATPGTTVSSVAITGIQPGENVVGIDYRPADGMLYALGSNARLYTLNPQTDVASFKVALA
eukprot:gene31167-53428_t